MRKSEATGRRGSRYLQLFERLNPLITERTPRGKLVQISAAEFERLRGAQIEKVSIPSLELWWVKE